MKSRTPSKCLSLRITSLQLGALLAMALGLLAVDPGHSGAQVIGSPVQISNLPDIENEPDVAVSGDATVAVWTILHLNCSHRVGWALSRDGGATWAVGGALLGEALGWAEPTV